MAMDENVIAPSPDKVTIPAAKEGDSIHQSEYKEWKPLYKYWSDLKEDDKNDEALKLIWDYASKKSQSQDKDSILLEVIHLKNTVKSPTIGEKPYAELARYVRIWKEIEQKETILKEMEAK